MKGRLGGPKLDMVIVARGVAVNYSVEAGGNGIGNHISISLVGSVAYVEDPPPQDIGLPCRHLARRAASKLSILSNPHYSSM